MNALKLGWVLVFYLFSSSLIAETINLDCEQGSRVELNQCLEQQLQELNASLQQVSEQALLASEELSQLSAGAEQAPRLWQQSLQSFLAYRDQQCAWESSMMASGTGSGTAYLRCLLELGQAWQARVGRFLDESE